MTKRSSQKSSDNSKLARVNVSMTNGKEAGINDNCHGGFSGTVAANDKGVMRSPRVVTIFWGDFYQSRSDVVTLASTMISDLYRVHIEMVLLNTV